MRSVPGGDERRAAVKAMVEWNEANLDAGLVYAPLLWESGAVGDAKVARPQDAITDQLLEKASGLIALFKHRLGTATGGALSGTCEEIEEALRRERQNRRERFRTTGGWPEGRRAGCPK